MSAPLRFLGIAVFTWAGVRAVSLGLFPGMTALVPEAKAATAVPADAGVSAPAVDYATLPEGVQPYPAQAYYPAAYGPQPPVPWPRQVAVPWPVYVPRPAAAPKVGGGWDVVQPTPAALAFEPQVSEPWPFPGSIGLGRGAPTPTGLGPAPPSPAKFDRWQMSAWALLRNRPGPGSLASGGGTLGSSQAGARLLYRFTPRLAASLRFSSAVGGVRSAEAAGGVRYQPFPSVPAAITIERRQGIGKYGGRSAFAALVEGGLYQRPLPASFALDFYGQAGIVGMRSRDWFADGALTVTRPLWRGLSGGFGVWGGAQTDLYRVDAGPRLTLDLGRGIRVHADYRQRLLGNASPPSGPALTVGADF